MSESELREPSAALRLAVGIATRGRAAILRDVIADIDRQTHHPDRVLVCGTEARDVAGLVGGGSLEILLAPAGLPRQRNAILDAAADCDVVLFLDDDFMMAPGYIAATLAVLREHPDIVVTTGWTIADGIKGPGFSPEAARRMIADDPGTALHLGIEPARHGYGCNMAIRLHPARVHGVRFDERLPLYGWSEDVDFTHRLGVHGRIVKVLNARGVHLGTKQGRAPGHRLGYSQVANPIYLLHKGSYSWGRALRSVGRNFAANVAKSLRPEPYVDRRGRLRGNGIAFLDLLRGRLRPERMLDL